MSKITWKQKNLIEELEEQLPLYSAMRDVLDETNIDELSIKEASVLIDELIEAVHEEDDNGWDSHKY